MAHDHPSHAHPHTHGSTGVPAGTMGAAVAVTLTFVVAEASAGWFAHSLALLSDAGHNLADAAALGFSWYAVRVAERPSHTGMTYGYHRMGVLAALANAGSLAVIALVIAWAAIARLRHPEAPNALIMIAVAATAVVLNAAIGFRLHRSASNDM